MEKNTVKKYKNIIKKRRECSPHFGDLLQIDSSYDGKIY